MKTTTPENNTSYDHIELSMEEEHACMQKAMEEKVRAESIRLYAAYVEAGLSQIEASAKAQSEVQKVEVNDFDLEPYLKIAREQKYYRQKTSQYFEKIKHPKEFTVSNQVFLRMCLDKLKALTGSEEMTKEFNTLFNYFTGGISGLDPNKGLMLIGNIGCGKTTLMKVFMENLNPYRMVSCREVSEHWKKTGDISKYCTMIMASALAPTAFGNRDSGICFDDLGIENKTKNYGDEINAMEEVILNWYDKKRFNRIHITTNLNPEEIEQKYGKRVRSRMREMFNQVLIEGGDRRI